MSTARLAFAIAVVLFGLALLADRAVAAGPAATSRMFSADFYLAGCKDFVAGRSNFFAGRCVGAIEVLDALNSDTKRFCPPDNVDNLQRVRTIVSYIEARPDRKNEDFRLLANEAMAKAWPCKS
jgi:Ssp1 endopeptidase immunity protein Rap1a